MHRIGEDGHTVRIQPTNDLYDGEKKVDQERGLDVLVASMVMMAHHYHVISMFVIIYYYNRKIKTYKRRTAGLAV